MESFTKGELTTLQIIFEQLCYDEFEEGDPAYDFDTEHTERFVSILDKVEEQLK